MSKIDNANLTLLDSNVQKTGDLLTLKYTEKDWINQPLASRVENVNPFNMVEFVGSIELKPFSDSWVRTIEVDGGIDFDNSKLVKKAGANILVLGSSGLFRKDATIKKSVEEIKESIDKVL